MDYEILTSAGTPQLDPSTMIVPCIFGCIIGIICLIALAKIFKKAGKPGWAVIVPFYNLYVLFEIAWGNGILFLLMLIPVVDFVVMIILYVKLAKAFGKGGGFAAGLIFLCPIFLCILGFGSAQYIGPDGVAAGALPAEAEAAAEDEI